MMENLVKVRDVIGMDSVLAGRFTGRALREAVQEIGASTIAVDFCGIEMITQSAADEFIGRLVRNSPELVRKLAFRNCIPDVRSALEWAAQNAFAVREPA